MRKPVVIAATVLALLIPPVASAQGRGDHRASPRHQASETTRAFGVARESRERAREAVRRPSPALAPPRPSRERASTWGPGQLLPRSQRREEIQDYGRYRLRPPPAGYDWVQVGRDIYLMQRSTGLVVEAIPAGP